MDRLLQSGHEAIGFGHEFDVSDPMCVARIAFGEFGPLDWVINCAAYTAVDKAEEDRQNAYDANALGPAYLSDACSSAGVKLLHVSTDFVFDGNHGRPYTEDDPTNPLNYYGESKLKGEQALLGNHLAVVVRSAWLFGPRGKCFPRSILAAADLGKSLRVVDDQIGTPTYTPYLASGLMEVIALNPFPGIYHLAGPDVMSWHEFASRAVRMCRPEFSLPIEAISSAEWPTPAKRPRYSALGSDCLINLGVKPLKGIDEALTDFAQSISSVR